MKNIRIETVGDINFDFPYLEVFFGKAESPFLEISISDDRQLVFKFYPSQTNIMMNVDELEYILSSAKGFLPKTLKNEDDYLRFSHE